MMKKTRNVLMTVYAAMIIMTVGIAIIFETDIIVPGILATESASEFVFVTVMELLTLAAAFFGLRLFKFSGVHASLVKDKEPALLKWGLTRILMLCLPMLADTLLYYIYMNTTFGYLAIILLLCLPFVFPSMERCQSEVEA